MESLRILFFRSVPGMGDDLVVKVHLIYIPNKCEKDLPI